ncbi:hypothetical protein AWE51_23075 [Aquimarina aggregata]|uniref:HTTM-like domain-containing protein n=1 Tax=Aquimarina aggregata TaxID=1642818 RepID=A0A163BDS8_9FLAO|nr:HTTM domain-containing protein [Aquimarina aggregata]KZS41290.1 hypothetical protein AWE51_23075 [Aquimarina aggregata]
MNIIKEILFKKISAKGLAIFRIAYSINFLFEIIYIYKYRQLYFDRIPYLDVHFPDNGLLLLFWMAVIICMGIGFSTRIMTIINYLFTIVFISSMTDYEYHMVYTYTGVNFLLMFLPIYKSLSIDLLKKKIVYLNRNQIYNEEKVSKINYFAPVLLGVGLVYFDSAFVYKINSPLWLNGLGVWLPSSVPISTITDNQWFLNQEFLVKLLSYITMVFEFMFIFLFWNKKFRIILFVIGVGLHIGILVEFPIPYFALGYLSIYLLMIPVSIWDKIKKRIQSKKASLKLYYNSTNLDCNKVVLLIKCLDVFGKIDSIEKKEISEKENINEYVFDKNLAGLSFDGTPYVEMALFKKICKILPLFYYSSKILFLGKVFTEKKRDQSQSLNLIENTNQAYFFPSVFKTDNFLLFFLCIAMLLQFQINYNFFGYNSTTKYLVNNFAKRYYGITNHDVFLDDHFKGFENMYTLKYKGELLPFLDEKGMCDAYISGSTYAYWMFRVNKPYVKENAYSLRKGFIEYSSFWAHRNNIDLSDYQEFEIVKKRLKISFEWEEDLLQKNIDQPWERVGVLIWNNKSTQFLWDSTNK